MKSVILALLLLILCQAQPQATRFATKYERGVSISSNSEYLVGLRKWMSPRPGRDGILGMFDLKNGQEKDLNGGPFDMTALSRDGRWLVAGHSSGFSVFYTNGDPKNFILVSLEHIFTTEKSLNFLTPMSGTKRDFILPF